MTDQKQPSLENIQSSAEKPQKRARGYQRDDTSKQLKPPKGLDPRRGPLSPGWVGILHGDSIIAKQNWTGEEADSHYDPRDSNADTANKFCRETLLAWQNMAPQGGILGQDRVLRTIHQNLTAEGGSLKQFDGNLKNWQDALKYGHYDNILKYFLVMKKSLEAIALWVATTISISEHRIRSHTFNGRLRSQAALLQKNGLEVVGLIEAAAKELRMGPFSMGWAMAYSNLLKQLRILGECIRAHEL